MTKKNSFAKQFKRGTMPVEKVSPLGPIYREAAPPSKQPSKARGSVAYGSMSQARPGLAAPADKTKQRKR